MQALRAEGLMREPLEILSRSPSEITLPEGKLIDFTSNDYLALAHHWVCIDAAQRAANDHGCGAGASPIVTGHTSLHRKLVERISAWLGQSSSVLFPSGYQANLGVLTSVLREGDFLFSDAHNHASLVDACRLARARVFIFPHLDVSCLGTHLARSPGACRRVVVTESLFSMDGSMAPLADIAEVCKTHQALLVVDEAHAMGVLGPEGRGICAEAGLFPDLLVGTLSKALGGHGAFVSASPPWIDYLFNKARPLIYSTALPAPSAAAALAAISLVQSEEGASLRASVLQKAQLLRSLLRDHGILFSGEGSPIASLSFSHQRDATKIQLFLRTRGILAWAFRPPSVPSGTSRLRISLSASHTEEQIRHLAQSIPLALAEIGAKPESPEPSCQ